MTETKDKKFNETLWRMMDQKPKSQEEVKETAAKDREEERRKKLQPINPLMRFRNL